MNLKELLKLSVSGVWGFINPTDKRIFISHSSNILSAISRNIQQIQDKSHSCRKLLRDLPHLQVTVFDVNLSAKDRKIRSVHWLNEYKQLGYTPYKDSIAVSYKLRTVITKNYEIQVQLVNKRNDKIIVGVFDKIDLATEFIQSTYPNNIVNRIIYSENSLTTLFHKDTKHIK